jgi:hypothetical protein
MEARERLVKERESFFRLLVTSSKEVEQRRGGFLRGECGKCS